MTASAAARRVKAEAGAPAEGMGQDVTAVRLLLHHKMGVGFYSHAVSGSG